MVETSSLIGGKGSRQTGSPKASSRQVCTWLRRRAGSDMALKHEDRTRLSRDDAAMVENLLLRAVGCKRIELASRQHSQLAQYLQNSSRANPGGRLELHREARCISIRDLESHPHSRCSRGKGARHDAQYLEAFCTTLRDDPAITGTHKLTIELAGRTNHLRIGS